MASVFDSSVVSSKVTAKKMNELYARAKAAAVDVQMHEWSGETVCQCTFSNGQWANFHRPNHGHSLTMQLWERTDTWVQCVALVYAQYN